MTEFHMLTHYHTVSHTSSSYSSMRFCTKKSPIARPMVKKKARMAQRAEAKKRLKQNQLIRTQRSRSKEKTIISIALRYGNSATRLQTFAAGTSILLKKTSRSMGYFAGTIGLLAILSR